MHNSSEDIMEWIGSEFDWDGFEKAKDERWKCVGPHHYHCELHNTHFDPDGYDENDCDDAEPCWDCYDEFNKNL